MPNKIVKKIKLSEKIFEMEIEAPLFAKKAQPGNFLIYRLHEKGERIPLTVGDYDREKGTITVIFMVVGKSTLELSMMDEGDYILDFVGPLGNPAEMEKVGTIVLIGGGVGIAPIYPQAKVLKELGNHVISIIGAKNKDLLFWEEKMKSVSDELIVCTDDGSYGRKGFVTNALEDVLKEQKVDRVIAIGPPIMMKFCVKVAAGNKEKGIPRIEDTWVSVNSIMLDGTGMCGGCRVETTEGTIFGCADGPDIKGHIIDWDNLMARNSRYVKDEKKASEFNHKCKIDERIDQIKKDNKAIAEGDL